MVKSWLSILMPNDEYKEKKILYFLAEASVLVFLLSFAFLVASILFPSWNLNAEIVLGVGIAVFSFYVTGRYIFSGIEYTDISTKKTFSKEKKLIALKSLLFSVMYFIVYSLMKGFPKTSGQWTEIFGFLIVLTIVYFLFGFISLKRSYKKNKELLDDE